MSFKCCFFSIFSPGGHFVVETLYDSVILTKDTGSNEVLSIE